MSSWAGASVGLFVVAGVAASMASMAAKGTLQPNGVIGLRTRATRSSAEAWSAGHKAAIPLLIVTAITGLSFALLTLVFSAVGSESSRDSLSGALAIGGYVGVFCLIAASAIRADRVARRS